jgi:hypothetical protein
MPDPRKRPSPRRRASSWTARELDLFLDATETSRYLMLFRLAAATGMRHGELLGPGGQTSTSTPAASSSSVTVATSALAVPPR